MRSIKKTIGKYEPLAETIGDTLSIFQVEQNQEGQIVVDDRLQMLIGGVSKAIAETIKMSFLGSLSGQVRLEKGLKQNITKDMIENKMPVLNLIGDVVGVNTSKYLVKHPEALGQLFQLAGPYLKNVMGNNGSNQAAQGYIGVMQ